MLTLLRRLVAGAGFELRIHNHVLTSKTEVLLNSWLHFMVSLTRQNVNMSNWRFKSRRVASNFGAI